MKYHILKYFLVSLIILSFFSCPLPESPEEAPIPLLMIQDYESENVVPEGAIPVNIWGNTDFTYAYNGDADENGTNDVINEIIAFSICGDGACSTTRATTVYYNIADKDTINYDGGAHAAYVTLANGPADLSSYNGLYFYAKGTGVEQLNVQITTTEQMVIFEPNRYCGSVTLTSDWDLYTIPWSDFTAQDWGFNIPPFDPSQVEWFYFLVEEFSGIQTEGEFSLDEIALY